MCQNKADVAGLLISLSRARAEHMEYSEAGLLAKVFLASEIYWLGKWEDSTLDLECVLFLDLLI